MDINRFVEELQSIPQEYHHLTVVVDVSCRFEHQYHLLSTTNEVGYSLACIQPYDDGSGGFFHVGCIPEEATHIVLYTSGVHPMEKQDGEETAVSE